MKSVVAFILRLADARNGAYTEALLRAGKIGNAFYRNWSSSIFFPVLGLGISHLNSSLVLFLNIVTAIFSWNIIARRPDLTQSKSLILQRLLIFLCLSLNFFCPFFTPFILFLLQDFPPEDHVFTYQPYHHGRLAFFILFSASILSPLAFWNPTAGNLLISSVVWGLVVCEYLAPGLGKLRVASWRWCFKEDLGNILTNAYLFGWVGFLDKTLILKLAQVLRALSPFVLPITLALELFSFLFLLNRTATNVWLALMIFFHILVVLAAGILFLEHVVILLSLLLIPIPLHNVLLAGLTILLVFDMDRFRPIAWLTTHLCEKVLVFGETVSGQVKELTNDVFSPRTRSLGIYSGAIAFDHNLQTRHIGEAHFEDLWNRVESSGERGAASYQYKFQPKSEWMDYFLLFMKSTHQKQSWFLDKLIPEGQLFYLSNGKYRFEEPLKKIFFVLRVFWNQCDDISLVQEQNIFELSLEQPI
jgi:hypothetical protein